MSLLGLWAQLLLKELQSEEDAVKDGVIEFEIVLSVGEYPFAYCFQLKVMSHLLQCITDHEFDAFGGNIVVKCLVEFVARVEDVIDTVAVLGRKADLVVDYAGLSDQQVVLDENSLAPGVVSVAAEIVQLVHVNSCHFVVDQVELPRTELSVAGLPRDQLTHAGQLQLLIKFLPFTD